ncbi:hypothetical protein [Methylobacter sp. YRD-M1]|uniref:hypothetical protein n=1 Tax=Methylobacter sp. YRD-M1 TaxID=2911520 RepID=UPI00227B22A9|nr:hypothetical protein [Methylobacter sp. YRD-M1]WAK02315.1 hypothetical protein LZ558_00610 [Methylobacter sp. YRD-M1]
MLRMSSSILNKLFPLSALILVAGCSGNPARPADAGKVIDLYSENLPKVAAEYMTTREVEEHEHEHQDVVADSVAWRFWRNGQQIVIERPQLGLGELWQRDGKTLIHRKLYHADRRAIEFQEDDLRMLEIKPSWQKLALLVEQKVLEQLSAGDVEWSDNHPIREYEGKIGDSQWHIVMRMDLGLPVLIDREHDGMSEHTELLNTYELNAAPWQPTPTNGYEIIDYADLGDKEYDPFVIKVQSQMGHDHHH